MSRHNNVLIKLCEKMCAIFVQPEDFDYKLCPGYCDGLMDNPQSYNVNDKFDISAIIFNVEMRSNYFCLVNVFFRVVFLISSH